MAEIDVKINGMSCQHCVMSVKKALDSIEGVSSSDVSVGAAKVVYDEAKTNKNDIVHTIQKAGYQVAA
jgi:copper chaperone